MRWVMYRGCNSCGFKDDTFRFEDLILAEYDGNACIYEVRLRCPVCDSKDLTDLYHDEKLTNPYIPQKISIPE